MPSVTLPYPPSANRYWRINPHTCRPYRSSEAGDYIEAVGWACVAQGCTEPTQETVALHLQFAHAAGRRIDLSNGIKVLEDALQGYAYADDKQVVHLEAELVLLPRKSEPYVIVTVTPRAVRELLTKEGVTA